MSDPLLPILQAPEIDSWHNEESNSWHAPPGIRDAHFFDAGQNAGLFLTNGSRVFVVDHTVREKLEALTGLEHETALRELGLDAAPFIEASPPNSFPIRSLSLAVAQKCNLACTYCYADGGDFGEAPAAMADDIAIRSVERLFAEVSPGDKVHLSFLGGEPMMNRHVVRMATEHAAQLAASKQVEAQFAITTNGTLLTDEDAEFFESYGFSVSISLDGIQEAHDQQRLFKSGRGSYETILQRIAPLLAIQQRMQVSARVTVTANNQQLRKTLDEFIRIGFHSVGFSPMLASPNGRGQLTASHMQQLLDRMIECGHVFERRIASGQRYPFFNMMQALKEIHSGTHRPYPCGAGAGYFGVSADGDLFACHRFVGDQNAGFGDVIYGVDSTQQANWLRDRHVDHQSPCRDCWARYLCGGGCHHEVLRRGRPACDFIRGWLNYCLEAYVRLLKSAPEYFSGHASPPA